MEQNNRDPVFWAKEQPAFTFRAGLFEYLLIGISASFFLFMLLLHPDPTGFLLLVTGTALILYWRSDFLFQISPTEVSYRHNFKLQTIPFDYLKQVLIQTGGRPPIAMIFVPSEDSKLEPIVINIKPLRRKDLQKLAIFLPKIAPHVQYDSRFLLMSEGKMPSLLFSYQ